MQFISSQTVAPGVTRAAIIRDADSSDGIGQFEAIASTVPSLGIDASSETERELTGFGRSPSAGLIVTGSAER
jgi:hypothetical protein